MVVFAEEVLSISRPVGIGIKESIAGAGAVVTSCAAFLAVAESTVAVVGGDATATLDEELESARFV